MDQIRQNFESWISSPPFEKRIERFPDDENRHAWPGSYREISVELAWQAWQEASKQLAGTTDRQSEVVAYLLACGDSYRQ